MMSNYGKRGRPTVADRIYGRMGGHAEKILFRQDNFRTQRSVSDKAYCISAAGILTEAASEIPNLEVILGENYMCRSILCQLGRMYRQHRFSKADIIKIANEVIQGRRDGFSVKECEEYIRHGRLTGEW